MSSSSYSDEEDNNDDGASGVAVASSNPLPSRVIVTVGTYDGVLAGWELKGAGGRGGGGESKKLEIIFATPVHGGSVRSLCLASSSSPTNNQKSSTSVQLQPGSLLSTGYDEMLKTHDWHRRLTSSGEVRTPSDFGTPVCSSFAPPPPTTMMAMAAMADDKSQQQSSSTHCIIGFSSGKLVIYKKRDWSIQHVLAGHVGGIASLAVHPTGKLALTGGHSDGKLKLWDLTKGRLSFVVKINASSTTGRSRAASLDPVVCLVWSEDGSMYGYCHGSHITVRDVATGKDWCDVELPSRVNQIALLQGPEGVFVAAACNDGSLPVLAVKTTTTTRDDDDEGTDDDDARRAIMAIEPVQGPIAGEERYKCIRTVAGYYVVTANSAGVVSLMNLQGAINMIMTGSDDDDHKNETDDGGENPAGSDSDNDADDSGSVEEEEMAVDIIDAVQLGSGARVTCLVTWAGDGAAVDDSNNKSDEENKESPPPLPKKPEANTKEEDSGGNRKRKLHGDQRDLEMDPNEIAKARELVAKAKKMQKRKDKRKDSKKAKKRQRVSPGE